jgi:hypothetical protein
MAWGGDRLLTPSERPPTTLAVGAAQAKATPFPSCHRRPISFAADLGAVQLDLGALALVVAAEMARNYHSLTFRAQLRAVFLR